MGRCAMRYLVGMAGFEPATSSSRTKRANRAALHPEKNYMVGMTGFEPATTRPPDEYSTGLSYIPSHIIWVGNTGFEPVTSALSRQRSKPTELITHLPLL